MKSRYDVVIIGGGLAGSALGQTLASNGIDTLIVERETRFRDRVRGEQLQPWGVAEARRLGVLERLRRTCGHDQPFFDIHLGEASFGHRDLRATTPQGEPGLNFYHPEMQESLLEAAEEAGAEVRRGAALRDLWTNGSVQLTLDRDGRSEEVKTSLVVGADGRSSGVRKFAGFQVRRDPPFLRIAGVLADDVRTDENAAVVHMNPAAAHSAAIFPQGNGRARLYAIYPEESGVRLQGERDLPRFVEELAVAGVPNEILSGLRFSGPLASFDGADVWVEHPSRSGAILIGDAAAANDPAWGQGLALSLMDARVLSDALLETDNWDEAGDVYAREHAQYYRVIHEVNRAMSEMFLRAGSTADARRARALPKIAEDPTRIPDHFFAGPDLPWNAEVKARFLAED